MTTFEYAADPDSGSLFIRFRGLFGSDVWHSHVLPLASVRPTPEGGAVLFDFRLAAFATDWDNAFSPTQSSRIGPEFTLALQPTRIAYVIETAAGEAVVRRLSDALGEGTAVAPPDQRFYRIIEGARMWLDIPDDYDISYSRAVALP